MVRTTMALQHKGVDAETPTMSSEWDSDDVLTMTSRQVLEGKQLRDHLTVSVNLDKIEIVRDDDREDDSGTDVSYITFDDIKSIWDSIFGGPDEPVVVDGDKTIIVKCRDCKVIVNQ